MSEGLGMPSIDQSRQLLLETIGPNPDLTLIRPEGNIGDELIWAGTRSLLSERIYREIGLEEVASSSGELAVIMGSGAWGRVYNQFMPELLAIAELRFSRVIVLPSTFEVSEDRVRDALTGSRATFFAREVESYRQISGLCRARLALDGAYYFDYSEFRDVDGTGELNAFRTDEERLGLLAPPSDNRDLSITAESLEDWLETISQFETVNTDRAHVMIAAALMGKRVNYAPSCYFKVDALAEALFDDYDVHRYPMPSNGHIDASAIARPGDAGASTSSENTTARVSVFITGRDDAETVGETIASSLLDDARAQVIVHDRNSRPRARRVLEQLAAHEPAVEFRFSDRDPGAAETLRLAAEECEAEYLIVLDYGMRLSDGALDRMIAVLDQHPTVPAVAPAVVDEDGIIQHVGGWAVVDAASISIDFTASGEPIDELSGSSTATSWVPTCGTLYRRSALDLVPHAALDDELAQSADWCIRAATFGTDALRVCPEAVIFATSPPQGETLPMFVSRRYAASELPAHAQFLERHGLLLGDRLAQLVPELRDPRGELDSAAANLLLTLVTSRGPEWTLMQWMNGGLDPIFAGVIAGSPAAIEREREELNWLALRHDTLIGIENGSWWKLRNRLQPLRRVAHAVRGRGKPSGEETQ